jgi:hypothetical protein
MLQTFFHALLKADFLPHHLNWFSIVALLVGTRAPIASRITQDSILPSFHSTFRKHQSIPQLCDIGGAMVSSVSRFRAGDRALQFFTVLDEIMVDMCNNPVRVDVKHLQKWKKLRIEMIWAIQNGEEPTTLPKHYFRSIHPCPALEFLPESDGHNNSSPNSSSSVSIAVI